MTIATRDVAPQEVRPADGDAVFVRIGPASWVCRYYADANGALLVDFGGAIRHRLPYGAFEVVQVLDGIPRASANAISENEYFAIESPEEPGAVLLLATQTLEPLGPLDLLRPVLRSGWKGDLETVHRVCTQILLRSTWDEHCVPDAARAAELAPMFAEAFIIHTPGDGFYVHGDSIERWLLDVDELDKRKLTQADYFAGQLNGAPKKQQAEVWIRWTTLGYIVSVKKTGGDITAAHLDDGSQVWLSGPKRSRTWTACPGEALEVLETHERIGAVNDRA